MKHLISFVTLFISLNIWAQTKYITKTGEVNFEASVPSFEEVKANNNSVTAIINAENGEFAALVLVKGFRFKNALMEEHFNENYAESDVFPKATFKGEIMEFDIEKLSEKNAPFFIDGSLSFHGKTNTLKKVPVTILKENNSITIFGKFKVNAADYNIKIPKIVRDKVSETTLVSFKFILNKK